MGVDCLRHEELKAMEDNKESKRTILQFYGHCLVRTLHEKSGMVLVGLRRSRLVKELSLTLLKEKCAEISPDELHDGGRSEKECEGVQWAVAGV